MKKGGRAMEPIYNFRETEMNGGIINFRDYQGKVLLIVNTASKCGLAPQLESIEKLYNKYRIQGFEVLGLPSNQFRQELGSEEEISEYCQVHYGVTFPMTRKIVVNGLDEDPLFTYLKDQSGKGKIKWNFTKFLIDKDGNLLKRFAPITKPEKMEKLIIEALKK
jgi:Glutathione peroxidase